MKNITVVSLGPGSREMLTLGALEAMKKAEKLVLRTGRCDAAVYLRENGVSFDTLDDLHETCEDFDELCAAAAARLKGLAEKSRVCYAVLDAAADETVSALQAEVSLTMLPGVPLSAPFLSALPQEKVEVQTASRLELTGVQNPLLILECDNRMLMGQCKLALLNWYAPDARVFFFPPSQQAARTYEEILLEDLDRQKRYDHTCAVLIPALPAEKRTRFDFYDLVRIMARLRGEGGCPWDREQTHESLRPYLIEEAYETAAAIDEQDWLHVADELGDVLLQVVFQANIGEQYATFSLSDVTTAICRKMMERHRHIFGEDRCGSAHEVADNWEKIKKAQRGYATQGEVLENVSRQLPALMRAEKVQQKARQVGFDWDDPRDALKKVAEESGEVLEALAEGDEGHLREECGDLLFACVNAVRLAGEESECCLGQAADKFVRRFVRMEKAILADGKALEDLTINEMDVYWDRIKHCPEN